MRSAPIRLAAVLGFAACTEPADDADATTSTTAADPVSYAACDDPMMGCADADCRHRDDAEGAWSICVPPCTEDGDCPSGAGGNVQVVCDRETDPSAGRCVLECVPQIMSCPSGTRCIDGDVAQCMWPEG